MVVVSGKPGRSKRIVLESADFRAVVEGDFYDEEFRYLITVYERIKR